MLKEIQAAAKILSSQQFFRLNYWTKLVFWQRHGLACFDVFFLGQFSLNTRLFGWVQGEDSLSFAVCLLTNIKAKATGLDAKKHLHGNGSFCSAKGGFPSEASAFSIEFENSSQAVIQLGVCVTDDRESWLSPADSCTLGRVKRHSSPYDRSARNQPVLKLHDSLIADASKLLAASAVDGIWLRTQRPPWYTHFPGTGTILDLPLLLIIAPFIVFRHFRPQRSETEVSLGYSGSVFCVRTDSDLAFIAGDAKSGTLSRVLRRYDFASLRSPDYDKSHSTSIRFAFDDSEPVLLYFDGVWSDLAEFFAQGSSLAAPPTSTGKKVE